MREIANALLIYLIAESAGRRVEGPKSAPRTLTIGLISDPALWTLRRGAVDCCSAATPHPCRRYRRPLDPRRAGASGAGHLGARQQRSRAVGGLYPETACCGSAMVLSTPSQCRRARSSTGGRRFTQSSLAIRISRAATSDGFLFVNHPPGSPTSRFTLPIARGRCASAEYG